MGKFNPTNAGTGITRIARSVAICIPAFEYQRFFELRQWPGIVGSQNLATGIQLKNALITHQVPYAARMAIMVQETIRMGRVGKTRKYCMRIVALASSTAVL